MANVVRHVETSFSVHNSAPCVFFTGATIIEPSRSATAELLTAEAESVR